MAGLCEGGNESPGSLKAKRVDEEGMMLKLIRKRKRNWLGHLLRRNCLLKDALEGMMNGRRVWGRRRYQMIDDIEIHGSYEEIKRKAENSTDSFLILFSKIEEQLEEEQFAFRKGKGNNRRKISREE
ncbi:hypothetical protein ANN_00604 [Periplaneta americana]|uniref:Uncharacterized protein n=1 Tax=Periplaneta americana TaxID=6978 RepID=A0ABQ8TU39_PERAM|nr:hypothetical protein ANN_00604 [Periplaneta americana]